MTIFNYIILLFCISQFLDPALFEVSEYFLSLLQHSENKENKENEEKSTKSCKAHQKTNHVAVYFL